MEIREQSLKIAQQFKSNWIELAEVISSIDSGTLFGEWGYDSLEDYCVKELHIKRPTLKKLLSSYFFLKLQEPKMLEARYEQEHFPQPDVVDILQRAHASNNVSEEQYESFKEGLLEQGVTKTTALKNLKEIDHTITGATETQRFKQTMGMVRRLSSFLDEFEDVPENYIDIISDIERFIQSKAPVE